MKRYFAKKKLSLTARLVLVLMPILIGVMVLFGHRCSTLYSGLIAEELTEQFQLQLNSVASQITASLSEINRMGFYVYAHQELREELAKALLQPEKFTASDRIELQSDLIEPMMMMIDSPGKYTYTLYPFSERIFCDYSYVRPISNFPEALPLDDMLSSGYAHTFYNVIEDSSLTERGTVNCLAITRVIYHSDRTPLAVLLTRVRTDYLEKAIQSILPEENSYYYQCVLTNGETLFEGGQRDDQMIMMEETVLSGRATLVYGVHPKLISEQSAQQRQAFLTFSIPVLLAAVLLISVLSHLVMRRMQKVMRKFGNLASDQELTEPPMTGHDEAAMLDQTFTRLYQEYRIGVVRQQRLRESQRLLENNLLVSRINPHFLYNTLSAIRWNLPQENWNTIDELVAFYRGVLSKGKEVAQLSGELELMGQYLSLQKFTYSRKISYTETLQPGTEALFIPKFILQPVFENAIQYGGENGELQLSFTASREGDSLILLIQNNGQPISGETMASLNTLNQMEEVSLYGMNFERDDKDGYGVFNVIMRVRLLFGEGYGLWLKRSETGGTAARFVLPACVHPEDVLNCRKNDKMPD